MKILFVSEYYHPKILGGGEINLHLIAKTLVSLGHEIHVATTQFKGLPKSEKLDGVVIRRFLKSASNVDNLVDNLIRSIIFPRSIIDDVPTLVKKEGFERIHLIGSSVRTAGPVKKRSFVPVCATVESFLAICPKGDLLYKGEIPCTKDCNFSIFSRCFRRSKEIGKMRNRFYLKNRIAEKYIYDYYRSMRDALVHANLIAVSRFIRSRLVSLGLSSVVIPNIIEIEAFDLPKKLSKPPRIIYLGSYTDYKGPQVLMEALDGVTCNAEFYGQGSMKTSLSKRAKTLKKANVKVLDQVPYARIPSIFQGADLVVFPSLWPEPFGRISVEAMASGTPIIGSRIGGIPETIDKDAGLLVPPGDPIALRDAIRKILRSAKQRTAMGQAGKAAAKKYAPDSVGRKLVRFYETCI